MALSQSTTAFAASGDLEVVPDSVRFAPDRPLEGRSTRIYATIKNNSNDDLYGTVRFYNKTDGQNISGDQAVSSLAHKTDDVFVNWTPTRGTKTIAVRIIPWQQGDNTENNVFEVTIFVDGDEDHDGIPDAQDTDRDGDKVSNTSDAFPDNGNEWNDTDHDGIGDNSDNDIDGDGIANERETEIGTNPYVADTDHDGHDDAHDAYPVDPSRWEAPSGGTGTGSSGTSNGNGSSNTNGSNGEGNSTSTATTGTNLALLSSTIDPFTPTGASSSPFVEVSGQTITLDATNIRLPNLKKVETVQWVIDNTPPMNGITKITPIDPKIPHEIKLEIIDNTGKKHSKSWNIDAQTSLLASPDSIWLILLALALLAVISYSIRASRRRKQGRSDVHHTS